MAEITFNAPETLNIHKIRENDEIQAKVAALYDRFPYPNYPLFARPRWQDGYLTSSYFAGLLSGRANPAPAGETLVAGCGEILPYIIRKWEPPKYGVVNVDLSRRSLRRGRVRTFFCKGRSEFHQTGIDEFLAACANQGRTFAHIETFGMLHHMADPAPSVAAMARQLMPGGTLRVMVYNSPGRWWIHKIQDQFKDEKIDILGPDPVAATRRAKAQIIALAEKSPELADKIRAIGNVTLDNPARVADMFLHPHELRWPVEQWLNLFTECGLELTGIFDRYGELDDLPNPLLAANQVAKKLPSLANAGRFEGNLELFWQKPLPHKKSKHSPALNSFAPSIARNSGHLKRLKFRLPPVLWFDFEETRDLAIHNRIQIWHAFLQRKKLAATVWGRSEAALKRLARLGAIMPDQLDSDLKQLILQPL